MPDEQCLKIDLLLGWYDAFKYKEGSESNFTLLNYGQAFHIYVWKNIPIDERFTKL